MASELASATVSLRKEEPVIIHITSADVQNASVPAPADAAGPASDVAIGGETDTQSSVRLSDAITVLKARVGACLNEYIEKHEGGGGGGEGDVGLWDGEEENGDAEEEEEKQKKKKGRRTGGKGTY
ncbi:hypothetical protein CLOM_g12233 [Closterium sp. NIES-68]|nr:hypothetical protein CLOM_g12233 [Closterium sp. NIES-68]GJP75138.1 hypothetical protein CLOP_g5624 [Closterium sp. NIES-67]